ncbi:MAG TPA: XRE family transcriptional regulator [Candidatus Limnocylindrales bacterium]|nr:XRE family transcriptional regulator [Candidatus Limnocylindrales bacterium]
MTISIQDDFTEVPQASPAGPDERLSETVATMVARLRRNSRMEIETLSDRSGIPVEVLRDIEAGRAVPALRTLWSLAHVFEVPFRRLILGADYHERDFRVLRADGGRTLVSTDARFRSRALSTGADPREPEVYEITLVPGCIEEAPGHPEGTYEHIVVVRGRLRVRTIDADDTLRAGDTLFFRADVTHWYENAGPCETIAVLTMTNAGDWVVG